MSKEIRIFRLIIALTGLGILIFLILFYEYRLIAIEELILLIIFFAGIGNLIINLNKLFKEKKNAFYRIRFIFTSILTIMSICLILYIRNISLSIIFNTFIILIALTIFVIGLSL